MSWDFSRCKQILEPLQIYLFNFFDLLQAQVNAIFLYTLQAKTAEICHPHYNEKHIQLCVEESPYAREFSR